MSVWREVQETLYQRWVDAWATRTPYVFGDEGFDPPAAQWARFSVVEQPTTQETLGNRGNRKFTRAGLIFAQLFEPPGNGVGGMSDLAEAARDVFEGCGFAPHNIQFNAVDIGAASEQEAGRWWGCLVQGAFTYEQTK